MTWYRLTKPIAAGHDRDLPAGTVVDCVNVAGGRPWVVRESATGVVVKTFANQTERAIWIGANAEPTE